MSISSPREPAAAAPGAAAPGGASSRLTRLQPGMAIPYGGDRVALVSEALARDFQAGDQLVVVQTSGELLRVPSAVHASVAAAVARAHGAFAQLRQLPYERIGDFFTRLAQRLTDDELWRQVLRANESDVESALQKGRGITRLRIRDDTRAQMIDSAKVWTGKADCNVRVGSFQHPTWHVETVRAPLGIVGFVFEARPNVLVDAAGVLAARNPAMVRIGGDATQTAQVLLESCIAPALGAAGLPESAFSLLSGGGHASAWALFSNKALALAVARGSGPTVATLGAVARQNGIPVSLHGTGGAWLVADTAADRDRFAGAVLNSLDRKVCNTLNVCCIVRGRAAELAPVFLQAVRAAGERTGRGARLHVLAGSERYFGQDTPGLSVQTIAEQQLAREWEWEDVPELSVLVCDDRDEAVRLFNRYSPRFVAALISQDPQAQEQFRAAVDAPFVGDGFTRWVDGQYAFDAPELGLSNWEGGRLLGRGGILSGQDLSTFRVFASHASGDQHR